VWIVWVEGNAIHLSSVGFCCYHNTCHGRQPRNRLHSALALGRAWMLQAVRSWNRSGDHAADSGLMLNNIMQCH
jgi:hypothetical protein